MTLTREQLLEKAKPRFAIVEIEGFGSVGVRSLSHVQQSRRIAHNQGTLERLPTYQLIDQLMIDKDTPMFTDDDLELLENLDAAKLAPLQWALDAFNGDDEKKVSAESNDT